MMNFTDVNEFTDANEFTVANDSYPICHSYLSNINCNKNENEDKDDIEIKGKTVPDVTFFYSDYGIHMKNWHHQTLIGKCHYNILSCKIDLRDSINPFRSKCNKNERKYKMVTIK